TRVARYSLLSYILTPAHLRLLPPGVKVHLAFGETNWALLVSALHKFPVRRSVNYSRLAAVGLLLLSSAAAQSKTLGYVTNYWANTVTVFDAETNKVIGSPIAVGTRPVQIAAPPGGQHVYVLNQAPDQTNGTV